MSHSKFLCCVSVLMFFVLIVLHFSYVGWLLVSAYDLLVNDYFGYVVIAWYVKHGLQ